MTTTTSIASSITMKLRRPFSFTKHQRQQQQQQHRHQDPSSHNLSSSTASSATNNKSCSDNRNSNEKALGIVTTGHEPSSSSTKTTTATTEATGNTTPKTSLHSIASTECGLRSDHLYREQRHPCDRSVSSFCSTASSSEAAALTAAPIMPLQDTSLSTATSFGLQTELDARSIFHEGEITFQKSVGRHEQVMTYAPAFIRPYVPEQHLQFYQEQPFLVVAARDQCGRMWSTLLFRHRHDGYDKNNPTVSSPSIGESLATTLHIHANIVPGDALEEAFQSIARASSPQRSTGGPAANIGVDVGILGIEFATKRRNRVNGRVVGATDVLGSNRTDRAAAAVSSASSSNPESFVFLVDQSFGNCPQYIKPRKWWWALESNNSNPNANTHITGGTSTDAAICENNVSCPSVSKRTRKTRGGVTSIPRRFPSQRTFHKTQRRSSSGGSGGNSSGSTFHKAHRRSSSGGGCSNSGGIGSGCVAPLSNTGCDSILTVSDNHQRHNDGTAAVKLSIEQVQFVQQAQTIFVATGYRPDSADGADSVRSYGNDSSHRGGPVGFVRVESDRSTIVLPEFAGNNHFNTLGNLLMDDRMGVAIPDFERGGMLQLSGTATVEVPNRDVNVSSSPSYDYPGALRFITFTIRHVNEIPPGTLPIRFSPPPTERTLVVSRIVQETAKDPKANNGTEAKSFYLKAPRWSKPLTGYHAGQHLPIRLKTPDGELLRTYSLSCAKCAAYPDYYRITVQKRGVGGKASAYLHDHIRVGDTIMAEPPTGDFILNHHHDDLRQDNGASEGVRSVDTLLGDDPGQTSNGGGGDDDRIATNGKVYADAIVFLSAGIGVTPIFAMLQELVTCRANSDCNCATKKSSTLTRTTTTTSRTNSSLTSNSMDTVPTTGAVAVSLDGTVGVDQDNDNDLIEVRDENESGSIRSGSCSGCSGHQKKTIFWIHSTKSPEQHLFAEEVDALAYATKTAVAADDPSTAIFTGDAPSSSMERFDIRRHIFFTEPMSLEDRKPANEGHGNNGGSSKSSFVSIRRLSATDVVDIVSRKDAEVQAENNGTEQSARGVARLSGDDDDDDGDGRNIAVDSNTAAPIDWRNRTEYYMCGPPSFVSDMESGLTRAGVNPSNIRYETF